MDLTRRRFLGMAAWAAAALAAGRLPASASPANRAALTKRIPASGEELPVVGMGTWRTFDVGNDARLRNRRTELLGAFFEGGGGMVDSSPMYGSSEATVGHAWAALGRPKGLFSATKVWTSFEAQGLEQIRDSRRLWGIEKFDLFQVHNLRAWEDHLPTLLKMKEEGSLKFVGVTTSHGRRHEELERVMRAQPLDFVQLTYNLRHSEAEDRLLGLARDRGIAVIANRPFDGGDLIDDLKGRPLPPWAGEVDCRNWPEFLLKWAVSHPAVTCAIPATSRVEHMRENMGAAAGTLPGAAARKRMREYVLNL
jgi:diketogulonate reductase-like aldo/keto reductase